jgi:hypothetical protein
VVIKILISPASILWMVRTVEIRSLSPLVSFFTHFKLIDGNTHGARVLATISRSKMPKASEAWRALSLHQ